MANSELTAAQREILHRLAESVDTERLDRLWIFDPQIGSSRETGLFVVSLRSDSRLGGEMRELITIRYTLEQQSSRPGLETLVMPEGWAPPDRIDRVMAGVLARGGDAAADPREEILEAGDSWDGLLLRLDLTG
jgi:hypothetical protein